MQPYRSRGSIDIFTDARVEISKIPRPDFLRAPKLGHEYIFPRLLSTEACARCAQPLVHLWIENTKAGRIRKLGKLERTQIAAAPKRECQRHWIPRFNILVAQHRVELVRPHRTGEIAAAPLRRERFHIERHRARAQHDRPRGSREKCIERGGAKSHRQRQRRDRELPRSRGEDDALFHREGPVFLSVHDLPLGGDRGPEIDLLDPEPGQGRVVIDVWAVWHVLAEHTIGDDYALALIDRALGYLGPNENIVCRNLGLAPSLPRPERVETAASRTARHDRSRHDLDSKGRGLVGPTLHVDRNGQDSKGPLRLRHQLISERAR